MFICFKARKMREKKTNNSEMNQQPTIYAYSKPLIL